MRSELLADAHSWLRIADRRWRNPLDPDHAKRQGGRWNPPNSFPALYLNEDVVTARLNLRRFIAGWPYEPEDLRDDNGPCLVAVRLPRQQRVADVHTRAGLEAVGLPSTYPLDDAGQVVEHRPCQEIGVHVKQRGLRGIRCRSARAPDGAGRELAWFPATKRSRVRQVSRSKFEDWFYG